MIKIFIVDDHLIFRESLSLLLTQEKIGDIIGESSNGKDFLDKIDELQPDLVIIDIMMPVLNGIEAAQKAIEKYPDLKIIALTSSDDEKSYHKMVAAGVKGFVLKSTGIMELKQAIREIMAGGSWFSNELLHKIIARLETKENTDKKIALTKRETEILNLICKSYSNKQIAEELHISYETVSTHKTNLLSKTNSTSLVSLVLFAVKNGMVKLD